MTEESPSGSAEEIAVGPTRREDDGSGVRSRGEEWSPGRRGFPAAMRDRLLLLACLALLVAVWFEPAGSWLAEPDEPRYAEIPREMLATHDFVVPRLNGVPYFEKPPLLYWANAAAMAALGETPFAARLPTRLAGLGTALLVLLAVGRMWGRRAGLLALALFLVSPLVLTFSRLNLTDGILTFFFTATLFAGYAAVRARLASRSAMALSALAGAMAAGAFLSKGLVGIVLPGGILFFWCLATRQMRGLFPLVAGPSVPVFAALATPWLWLAELRNPGFLRFFFIHEHFQRFATDEANRPGPIYYFVLVFVAGFLPCLAFFARGLRPIGREHPHALFFLIWFTVVLVFFSVSHSKLSPYLFPAFPAAAALAARGILESDEKSRRRSFGFAAISSLIVALAAFGYLSVRPSIVGAGAWPIAWIGGAILAAGAVACFAQRKNTERALGSLCLGWAGLYLALALLWPHTLLATGVRSLALAAQSAASSGPAKATIVSYCAYVQGVPWTLKSVVPVVDYTGELEPQWLPKQKRREIFWSREEFWRRWRSGERLVVFLRKRNAPDFQAEGPVFLFEQGKHQVIANFKPGG